jgi:hypothetical protein
MNAPYLPIRAASSVLTIRQARSPRSGQPVPVRVASALVWAAMKRGQNSRSPSVRSVVVTGSLRQRGIMDECW